MKKSDTCVSNVLKAEWQNYKVNGFPFERCYLGRILTSQEFKKRKKKTKYKQKTTTGSKNQPSKKEF